MSLTAGKTGRSDRGRSRAQAPLLPCMIDLSIFGSKADTLLAAQAAVLTAAAGADGGGIHAVLEGTQLGLERLSALPPDTFRALALRLRAACSPQEIGRGTDELAAWPEDLRALAAPPYEFGMPVHCLPIYAKWQHEPLHAFSDLREQVPCSVFFGLSTRALASSGVTTDGLGSHSFRRSRAMELLHGGAPPGGRHRGAAPQGRSGYPAVHRRRGTLGGFASSMTNATAALPAGGPELLWPQLMP